jgi:hypothetical protein
MNERLHGSAMWNRLAHVMVVFLCVFMCMCVYVCVYVYVYVYVYVCIYMPTEHHVCVCIYTDNS